VTEIKRGRGRPKGSKNKPKPEHVPVEPEIKRGRGRPKGSKNKPKPEHVPIVEPTAPRKRGRPRKIVTEAPEPTTPKKRGRGRSLASLHLIERMYAIAQEAQPITGRGIGYKLFVEKLIPDMSKKSMAIVYRLLKEAREEGIIPWEWIVDETRGLERRASWDDPEHYAESVERGYRRDLWNQQPVRVEVWSEKGTVRGVVAPVLNRYGVGFRPFHGFDSATEVHDISIDQDGRKLIALYIGDYDCSGMCMSEVDLPKRLPNYGATHVELRRLALTIEQCHGLPSFPASDKRKDRRYNWFVTNYGDRCWELDAMDPRVLRNMVEEAIKSLIDWEAWNRMKAVQDAEIESLKGVLKAWHDAKAWADPAI
jgi:hypothetical protein